MTSAHLRALGLALAISVLACSKESSATSIPSAPGAHSQAPIPAGVPTTCIGIAKSERKESLEVARKLLLDEGIDSNLDSGSSCFIRVRDADFRRALDILFRNLQRLEGMQIRFEGTLPQMEFKLPPIIPKVKDERIAGERSINDEAPRVIE